ncbi:hypothetical protein YPPY53_0692, partial [Yersinia pestis PY-53]
MLWPFIRCQPEFDFGACWCIPPVAGGGGG